VIRKLGRALRARWDERQARRARAIQQAVCLHPAVLVADGRILNTRVDLLRDQYADLRDTVDRVREEHRELVEQVERREQARIDELIAQARR